MSVRKTVSSWSRRFFHFVAGSVIFKGARQRLRGRGAILCYHRVLADSVINSDPNPNKFRSVSLTRFEQQMSYIASNYSVVSMDQFWKNLSSNQEGFVVAVTFDDGYKDNLECALPILKKYNIPATIYVTTKFIENDFSLWWYELWDILNSKDRSFIQVNGSNLRLRVSANPKDKIELHDRISSMLATMPLSDNEKFMNELRGHCIPEQYFSECLSLNEIRQLDQEELITIGAHTHSHPNLNKLSSDQAELEMLHSKSLLEQELGHPIKHFAYPYGNHDSYGQREQRLLEKLDFLTAVTCIKAPLRNQGPYDLPRYGMTDFMTPRRLESVISGVGVLEDRVVATIKRALRY